MKPIIILIVASIEEQEQQELTSIHQIKPILVSHVAKLIKYLYSKSPCCAWMEGLRATHCKPMSWMGALHGEWRIYLHISPSTRCFCSIAFATIYLSKGYQNTKNHSGLVRMLHWNLHIRSEPEKCQLGGPYPRSMLKPYSFWASDNPLWHRTKQTQYTE